MKYFREILSKEYWENNSPEYTESKFKFFGLIIAILVCIFGYTIQRMNDNRLNEKIANINQQAEKRQRELKIELDSLNLAGWLMSNKIHKMELSLKDDSIRQSQDRFNFNKNFNELKNYKKNEKNHIPNATFNEQFDFISKYKYQPIAGD